jgi:hypothetical protein
LLRLRTDKVVTVILNRYAIAKAFGPHFNWLNRNPIRVSAASLRNMSGERKYHTRFPTEADNTVRTGAIVASKEIGNDFRSR